MFYARPVIPLLMAMICGIITGTYFPVGRIWAYLTVFVAASLIFWWIHKKQTAIFSPLILFFGMGCLSILSYTAPHFPPNHIINYTDSDQFDITGYIASRPVKKNERWRFILKTEFLKSHHDEFRVFGNLRVTARDLPPDLENGDRISFASRIWSIRNFNNPGGFNYKRYMAFQNVWGTAYVRENNISVLQKNIKRNVIQYWRNVIEASRFRIAGLIDNISASMESKTVLQALLIGERNSIPPSLREAFNRAGAGHLLAISGLHIGMVATAAFMIFQSILIRFKPFLWNAWTKKGAALLSLVPIWAYALLAGMPPSTQRAAIMVTVFMLAFLLQREQDAINTLAVAAMLILMVFPPTLFSISFQLSFAAVLAILYGLSVFQFQKTIAERRWTRLRRNILAFCCVSGFAILGTLPLTMFYFDRVSLIGIASNIILVPLIGSVVLPAGLISVCMYPFSEQIASLGLEIAAFVMDRALDILYLLADIPFAAVRTFTPTVFEISCYYILLWTLLALRSNSVRMHPRINGFSVKTVYRIIAAVVVFALCVDVLFWMHQRFWHNDLKITILDVGQGNAALLELPGGDCMLIDGGGFSDRSVFDVGEKIIAPFLRRKKILTVNTIVLTHPDSDHLNGLPYIAEHFHVDRIWTNNQPANTLGYRKFIKLAEEKHILLPLFQDLARNHTIKNVGIQILYPTIDFANKMKDQKWCDSNNNSLVLKIRFGSRSLLFPGDIMQKAEEELVALAGAHLKSNVLIAPHHGSRSSSTKRFLDKVKPEIVIISSGRMNRFHFPHSSVLKRYNQRGYAVFRTDWQGAITLSTDGHDLEVRPFTGYPCRNQ